VSDWAFLRAGFVAVGLLIVAALVGWAVETARYEDRGFQELTRCLVEEKGLPIKATPDVIALTADLGALDTVIETNPVTVSVSSTAEKAEEIVALYRTVGGDLGTRVELRGRTVYLFEAPPSPTERQTLFDCTY
jgi:hypothetical protein